MLSLAINTLERAATFIDASGHWIRLWQQRSCQMAILCRKMFTQDGAARTLWGIDAVRKRGGAELLVITEGSTMRCRLLHQWMLLWFLFQRCATKDI
jgi:hypothetical protein